MIGLHFSFYLSILFQVLLIGVCKKVFKYMTVFLQHQSFFFTVNFENVENKLFQNLRSKLTRTRCVFTLSHIFVLMFLHITCIFYLAMVSHNLCIICNQYYEYFTQYFTWFVILCFYS